jgi:UDP-N-acetyl-2-amino-2-deoxyglucuronate dehydrogenase
MNKNFALIGAAGYIAPRHMKAIKENNCNLIVASDLSDSVGILDSYFPECNFFTEIERFDRYIDKLKNTQFNIDYFSICSPNYLHDSHIRLALRNNAHAICEKPLVINPENLDFLKKLENEVGKKTFVILQLRHHPVIISLKNSLNKNKKFDIDLNYITSRGSWYLHSWKGNENKSGGLASNIGIHFFDMLLWIFGDLIELNIFEKTEKSIKGLIELERANVKWKLSIDPDDLPREAIEKGSRAFRSIKINGEELEFSDNFTDLHTLSYLNILNGNGFGIEDARPSLEIVSKIKNVRI